MAKNDTQAATSQIAALAAGTIGISGKPKTPLPMPALGSTCGVMVAEGQVLVNNETGARFEEGKETPQTVTVTTLRRLEDGCLVRVS
ncbi:hypothetical protein [Polaromonas sp. UC242_47]|uniref:hypothetical protein n=1 Tax=Polaromonas sp. UC242_47 TaxID=3374626 RepID=UPI0037984BDD